MPDLDAQEREALGAAIGDGTCLEATPRDNFENGWQASTAYHRSRGPSDPSDLWHLAEAIHRLNIDWEQARTQCGDPKCQGDCQYVAQANQIVDRVLGRAARSMEP